MGIRVLLADEQALLRAGERSILGRQPDIDIVGETSDGASLLAQARSLAADVVVLDVDLPHLCGVDTVRRLRETLEDCAVLVLTACQDRDRVIATLEAGAAGYLLKGAIAADELVTAVRAVHRGGSVLSPMIAVHVLSRVSGDGAGDPSVLTGRERDVLRIAARGVPNKVIAQELDLSLRTVELHMTRVFSKLRVDSRTAAVVAGLQRGWLRLGEIGPVGEPEPPPRARGERAVAHAGSD